MLFYYRREVGRSVWIGHPAKLSVAHALTLRDGGTRDIRAKAVWGGQFQCQQVLGNRCVDTSRRGEQIRDVLGAVVGDRA